MSVHHGLLAAVFLLFSHSLLAGEWSLSIQPVLSKKHIEQAYQPLADYLSKQTGETIRIRAHRNFIAYWASLQKMDGFDFVLDAAHFTDYRLQHMGYHLLARLPDTVTFSLVTRGDKLIFDVDELIARRVASLSPPSVGALRLLQLFPDPMRQPRMVYVNSSEDAVRKVIDGKADAAMIPNALVPRFDNLNTVLTTEPLPHMGFSASPDVPQALRSRVSLALRRASLTPAGRKMLQQLRFPAFIPASPQDYKGYARLLDIMPKF